MVWQIALGFRWLLTFKKGIKGTIDNLLVGALKNIPGAQSLVDAKLKEVLEELKEEIGKTPLPNPRYSEFPESGLDQEQIINILNVCAFYFKIYLF